MQLYIVLLGLLVSLLVLINIKSTNRANYYLFFFIILVNLFVVMNYATMISNNKYLAAIFMVHFMPLVTLTGPSLYLYFRSILSDDASLKKIDWLHLIVPVFLFVNNFRFNFLVSFDQKLAIGNKIVNESRNHILNFQPVLFSGEIVYFIRSIVAIFYVIFSTVLLYRHFKNDIRKQFQNVLIYRWLLILLFFNYVYNFSILYYVIKMLQFWQATNGMNVFYMSAYYFAIGSVIILNLTLFFFPSILYGLPRMDFIVKKPIQNDASFQKDKEVDANLEEENLSKEFEISLSKLKLIQLKVDEYIVDKPYLKSNFSISLMSKEMGIPVHHLSYFFNEYLHTDFSSWKNNARIEFVVTLIQNGSNQYLTLDAISKQAGYVSRSTFVNAFKQKMGQTPSEYINSI